VSPLTGNAFWEEVGPYTYLDALKGLPSYFWSNLKDEPTSQVILLAANLGSKLLVGPGSHCVPPPGYDLGGELQRFFDHHLKGIDNGIDRDPRTQLYVEQAPAGSEWLRSDTLPGAQSTRQDWYPGGNALATSPPPAGSAQLTVDYDVGAGEYFAFWVESQAEHGLTFTSAPLAADLHLEGYPLVHLNVAADRDDVNVFAYLEDISADASAEVIASGRLAASYRATGAAPYDTLGLPWHPGRSSDHQPLVPGMPVELDIALLPVSRVIPAGHRLRFVVTGADPRQRNLADIRQEPPPVITLQLGGGATRVSLPVRE
jgi:putative CocE/NonD family hydrolase